jgi:hypothetical protein
MEKLQTDVVEGADICFVNNGLRGMVHQNGA